MGKFSAISKLFSGLFKVRPSKQIFDGAGNLVRSEVIRNASKSVVTWGNAAKVAIVGGFTYVFLTGGLSQTVSRTLGISETSAQALIWVIALVLFVYIVKRIWGHISYTVMPKKSYKRRRY